MASLTIRDLDEDVKEALRRLAAASGRSMEAEARIALSQHVTQATAKQSLKALFDERFPEDVRVEKIDFGPRGDARPAPQF